MKKFNVVNVIKQNNIFVKKYKLQINKNEIILNTLKLKR